MKTKNYISFLLVGLIATQSIIAVDSAPVTPQQLDGYFTRLKRGIKCYWQKTPCRKEDKETVMVSAVIILTLVTSLLFHARQRYNVRKEIIDTRVEDFMDYAKRAQLDQLEITIKASKKDNIPLPIEHAFAIIIGKIADVRAKYIGWQEDKKRYDQKAPLAPSYDYLSEQWNDLVKETNNLKTIVNYLKQQPIDPDKKLYPQSMTIRSQIYQLLQQKPARFTPHLDMQTVQDYLGLGHLLPTAH